MRIVEIELLVVTDKVAIAEKKIAPSKAMSNG